jgi:hypothetical protein
MRSILAVIFTSFLLNVQAQLDQAYYGTYLNEDATEAFTIYYLDELSEHCFLVDYEKEVSETEVTIESGYGYCDENDGSKAFFYLESFVNPINVEFYFDEYGMLYMSVRFPNKTDNEIFYFEGDIYESDSDEIIFERPDGTQLVLFPTENDEVGFAVSGVLTDVCDKNEITGVLVPTDETLTAFLYTDSQGCELKINFYDQGAIIAEKNCGMYRTKSCPDWSGTFYFAE